MKKLRGFSLAEMMVVLLIISIVAAAAAPMVNKRALSIAAERTPWVWTNQNNIAFGFRNGVNQIASVGWTLPPAGETPKLYWGKSRVLISLCFALRNIGILFV